MIQPQSHCMTLTTAHTSLHNPERVDFGETVAAAANPMQTIQNCHILAC